MGIHPNAGWRSFKTDQDVVKPELITVGAGGMLVWAQGLLVAQSVSWRYLTDFGQDLLDELVSGHTPAELIRYRNGKQFEIFVGEESGGWEEHTESILRLIAKAHSRSANYTVELRDMSGGEPTWQAYFLEELEEIEEYESSFAAR